MIIIELFYPPTDDFINMAQDQYPVKLRTVPKLSRGNENFLEIQKYVSKKTYFLPCESQSYICLI